MDELKKLAERNDAMSSSARDELRIARKRVDEMSSELARLKAQVRLINLIFGLIIVKNSRLLTVLVFLRTECSKCIGKFIHFKNLFVCFLRMQHTRVASVTWKINSVANRKNMLNALDMRDAEIRRLREALEEQISEFKDLMDIKIALDAEIAAYRKLLEAEETR